jgi:hypothetical protein
VIATSFAATAEFVEYRAALATGLLVVAMCQQTSNLTHCNIVNCSKRTASGALLAVVKSPSVAIGRWALQETDFLIVSGSKGTVVVSDCRFAFVDKERFFGLLTCHFQNVMFGVGKSSLNRFRTATAQCGQCRSSFWAEGEAVVYAWITAVSIVLILVGWHFGELLPTDLSQIAQLASDAARPTAQ